jgi:hypothetical protein
LVEPPNSIHELKDISVPCFASFGESNAKTINEKFFNLLEAFYLGRGYLPQKEHLHGWLDVLRPEYTTWNADLKYEKNNFLKDLQDVKSVEQLCSKLNKSEPEIYNWLNDVYSFLIEQNCLKDFDDFSIIPNMEGNFRKLSSLKSDFANQIPLKLMDLYNKYNSITIQSWMINRKINSLTLGKSLEEYSLKDFIGWVNSEIDSDHQFSLNGSLYKIRYFLAYNIIELYPDTNEDNDYIDYRKKLYNFSNTKGERNEFSPISVVDHDLWREADKYWFNHNYENIAKSASVKNLAETYFKESKNIDETLLWLNDYISFYRENSKGDFIKDKKIFPDQRLDFKSLNDLRYDDNIEEIFKDLANYAVSIDFSKDKYRHCLLHRSISGYEKHNPLTLKEVYEFVKGVFDTSSAIIRDTIAKYTISIIPKTDDSGSQEVKLYKFVKTLFGDTIPEITYTEYSSGFNWGFAQEFYLKKLCSTISESINLQGLKNKSTGFSEYSELNLTEWVDNVIEFLHSFKIKNIGQSLQIQKKGLGYG